MGTNGSEVQATRGRAAERKSEKNSWMICLRRKRDGFIFRLKLYSSNSLSLVLSLFCLFVLCYLQLTFYQRRNSCTSFDVITGSLFLRQKKRERATVFYDKTELCGFCVPSSSLFVCLSVHAARTHTQNSKFSDWPGCTRTIYFSFFGIFYLCWQSRDREKLTIKFIS